MEWSCATDEADAKLVRKKLCKKIPGGPGAECDSAVLSAAKKVILIPGQIRKYLPTTSIF